jgi:3-hydroxyisobutyrate dehydrogenase-like beta-hydroxyacid dehydrogenase
MTGPRDSQSVCVIGVGNMGGALADSLLKNGYRVIVWNRTATKCVPLAEAGATVADSVAAAACATQVIIVCVDDHEASMSVLWTEEVGAVLHGKLLVQLSSVTADESRDMGCWAQDHGIGYLEGGILATPALIRANEGGSIVFAGPRNLFDTHASLLASLAGHNIYLGEELGSAANFEKAIDACYYGSMLAFFHGAAMCHAAGLPVEPYVDHVAAGNQTRQYMGGLIAKRSYGDISVSRLDGDAALYQQVAKLSAKLGVDATVPTMVTCFLDRAIAEGHAGEELAAIFELMVPRDA